MFRKRWDALFSDNETPADIKEALKSQQLRSPCDDGLRSICWKAFFLYDNLDRSEWTRKISNSRSAYSALRSHFLKYIEHPNDLVSTVDPLADDEESPWQSLRRDEAIREEIYQDVERCLQENFFFREPSTKLKMLDILFIYSKLNPDLGYRQGMHELLAPVLWVVERDAIDKESLKSSGPNEKFNELMLQSLDADYIEHDSFTLFCSIMQTTRVYYEHGNQRSSNGQAEVPPIVSRSQHVLQDLLMAVDPELAEHLHAIEVLPQIFLTRWMRLLFAREFPFEDVLSIWDHLFANGLRMELIDSVCVAMLLRIRWQLLEADYSSALSLLLRYPSPDPHKPHTFVQDGLYLEQKMTPERGASIISKYSGKLPGSTRLLNQPHANTMPARVGYLRSDSKNTSQSSSPGRSPARINQRNLETLFQDVSEGLQRRTESWSVAKAVRGAMAEAKRNIQSIQSEATSPTSRPWDTSYFGPVRPPRTKVPDAVDLNKKIELLEYRNKMLANMLGEALKDLNSHKEDSKNAHDTKSNEAFEHALAMVESVQICLDNSSIPIASAEGSWDTDNESTRERTIAREEEGIVRQEEGKDGARQEKESLTADVEATNAAAHTSAISVGSQSELASPAAQPVKPTPRRPATRPPLAETEFSWMLGDNRQRSSFVSSASVPPEQSRHGDTRSKQNPLFGDGKEEGKRKPSIEDDGVLLKSLGGSSDRR
ncbi:hypothetical protein VTN00DRAFT_2168 [Thermoascus crustaceus]|uniref:uncharacterized protein n=1 Tax=Thermoascus crustaceus TaxID=5088 RepID=UPI003743BCFA